ncbi:MAG TPA: helix-turn-helix domain-containing protein [Vicinamibacterales bacterium]|jgi:excisionase family DNA binding protein|nr:helix-turn-helix domain-containing protein [Vicinamibacterales bacterium]
MELEAFLTTDEVLGYLKTTPRTIYRLIRTGELPAIRIGRQWRFRRSDLDGWLDRQRAGAAAGSELKPVILRSES